MTSLALRFDPDVTRRIEAIAVRRGCDPDVAVADALASMELIQTMIDAGHKIAAVDNQGNVIRRLEFKRPEGS